MFNPASGMWSAFLAPPPPGLSGGHAAWRVDWERYCELYGDFEIAMRDPEPGRPALKGAIEALAQCNYVHLGSARVIQTEGSLRTSMVRDITNRHCLLNPVPTPERIHWCSDDSVNLNTQTGMMRDMSTRGGVGDDATVVGGAEPMEEEEDQDEDEQSCIYLTRDPRRSASYAAILWRVATQSGCNIKW